MLGPLRTKPFRGDQVAAGAVVLTVLVALVDLRFAGRWPDGTRFVLTAAAAVFVGALGFGSPQEPASPRGYQTTLYVTGYTLCLLALLPLARMLGAASVTGSGTAWWIATALAGYGAAAAVRGSATGSLLVGLSGIVAVLAFCAWAFGAGVRFDRWLLVVIAATLALCAVAQRDHRPSHAVQLANAGGIALLTIAFTPVLEFVSKLGSDPLGALAAGDLHIGLGWGWELVLLAGGFGLVAYAAVDHARGPAVIGLLVLVTFTLHAALGKATLAGWPIPLAIAAAVLLVIGLRPTTPAPPEPGADAEPSPVVPVDPLSGGR